MMIGQSVRISVGAAPVPGPAGLVLRQRTSPADFLYNLDPAALGAVPIPFFEMVYHDCELAWGK